MKKILLGIFIGIVIGFLSSPLVIDSANNYFKKWKKCQKQVEKLGNEYESCYMDLIQCQRVINNENPWEEMMK